MTNPPHLLVPLKVQALVIDDLVIEKKAILKVGEQRRMANDGKWSPLRQDYRPLTGALGVPGPDPFYGATRTAWGQPAQQLVLAKDSPALPEEKHRGVYLHWILPPGLRHAHKSGSLDFPPLPDQWLIVRFNRAGAERQTKAWFLDGGLVDASDDEPTNLLFARGGEYTARKVGKVVPLDEFKRADFQGERTTITAVGNRHTGSPTFTAYVAENRNVLSWHDDLDGLTKPHALSYLLLGWYHDEQHEPFAVLPAQLKDARKIEAPSALDVLEALGWRVESHTQPPADLLTRRCLFHGMVAHINYWSQSTYKGQLLGYPGSPSVEGVLGSAPPSFKVGVGASAEDALVSLVSSEYSGKKDAPNLWKALEAVIYRQPESLVGSWNAAPRDMTVHQSWFTTHEAGKVWSLRARPKNQGAFPDDPDEVVRETAVKPTAEQLAALKRLNELQAAADAVGRELSALQQDLYARWWMLCKHSRRDRFTFDPSEEEGDCRALAERVKALRAERDTLLERLRSQQEIAARLPEEIELQHDAAPRFWTPADPVVVVKNCGVPTKHQFPRPLSCRLPEQTITAAEVTVANDKRPFDNVGGVAPLAAAIKTHFAPHDEILTRLVEEASLVEQAINDLAARSLPPDKQFFSAGAWRVWTERLVKDLMWDGQSKDLPLDEVRFGRPGAMDVLPSRLVELWVQQPWSPLFIDWQITWFPTPSTGEDFGPVWRFDEYDYQPKDRRSIPTKGHTFRGRSLLSPVDGRLFKEPLDTLRELLKPRRDTDRQDGNSAFPSAVADILSRYQVVWDRTLKELEHAGMMGQALTGFHQALLRRDVMLPRVMPDPARPWAADQEMKFRDDVIAALLDTPEAAKLPGERLAPPSPTDAGHEFELLRAGAFRLDELWLVDDFGQWADLLRGTSAGGSAGQVFHPRARWHDDPFVLAMPPRVVQPVRLNFRFTAADDPSATNDADATAAALAPVCGWIFYNPLDRALALCDRDGRLTGELVVVEESGKHLVKWEPDAGGGALDEIRNADLRAFARSLVETAPTAKTRLHELLELIDGALKRIRPAAARRDAALFGRPLALVSTRLGLELFGKAWTDPREPVEEDRPAGAGDARLDALRVRVLLGYSHNTEDGLVGYFKAGDFNRLVPAHTPSEAEPPMARSSNYIADPERDAVRVGFGAPESLTLLMDPWGSVQAAVGIVPAKTIMPAQSELDGTLARMEASFRVGPVLMQPDRIALPTPVGEKGRWHFRGPLTGDAAIPVAPSDPRYFGERPVVAADGRLLLLTAEEQL